MSSPQQDKTYKRKVGRPPRPKTKVPNKTIPHSVQYYTNEGDVPCYVRPSPRSRAKGKWVGIPRVRIKGTVEAKERMAKVRAAKK